MEQQIKDLLVDHQKFGAWLAIQPSEQVVGRARSPDCCPIANFLSYSNDKRNIVVSTYETDRSGSIYVGDSSAQFGEPAYIEQSVDLPYWANQFAVKVDDCGVLEITAAKALEILFVMGCYESARSKVTSSPA